MDPNTTPNTPTENVDNQPTETLAPPPAPTAEAAPTPAVADNTASPAPAPTAPTPKTGRKVTLLVGLAAAAVVVFGGSAAAYFGVVVPNKPENIWATALDRTAKGYDELVKEGQKNKDIKGTKTTGTFKVDSSDAVFDGNIDVKTYDKDAELKMDVGAAGQRINIEMLAHVTESSVNPDIYIKATGLKGLDKVLGEGAGEMFGSLENQWYFIDHTLLDQMQKSSAAEDGTAKPELTGQDVTQIAEAFGRVNRQYLLTDNKDRAVLTVVNNVGKEKLDDRSAYHYKVGYNKNNLKAYVTALKDEAKKTKLNEYFKQKDKSFEEAISFDNTLKEIDKLDGKGTADVWVDMKTKLIRKVRFTDSKNPKSYFDVSLKYNGGDVYPFVFNFHSEEGAEVFDANFSLSFDTAKNSADLTADFKSPKSESAPAASGNLKLTTVPSNDKINFTKPANAKSLTELLSLFMGGGAAGEAGLPTSEPMDDSVLQGFDFSNFN